MFSKSQPRTVKFHDASFATLDPFNRLTYLQAEFLKAVNFIRPANKLINPGALTGGQHLKRNRFGHGRLFKAFPAL